MEPVQILITQRNTIARGTIELVPQIVVAITVLFVTLLVKRVVVFLMQRGLGLGSVAIGFAFKDVFENFLAGIIILFRREMRIDDHIECEDAEGKVAHISLRESHIMQADGPLVIMPNSILFKNPVIIRTAEERRRVTVMCGVAYDVDLDEARAVLTRAVKSCDTVITDGKPIQIFAQVFGDSSINFEVTWWIGSAPVDVRTSRDQVVRATKAALDAAGIEIPFPYRTLTFKEPLPIASRAD